MNRPKINLPYTITDYLAEAVAIVALIIGPLYLFWHFGTLDSEVPLRYDSAGNVTSTGSPLAMFLLVGVSVFTYALLTIISKYPHVHNYPVEVTPENVEKLYKLSRTMLVWLKAICAALFTYIIYGSVEIAMGNATSMNSSIMYLLVAASLIVPIATVFSMFRYRNNISN
ncbi:MAG: hypothetical protein LAT57_09935 [Balneolales bacterium]|nr:hypothetical protein [Balneolales bacterium]